METIRDSDLRTDKQGSRMDHSHCSPFVAVGTIAAVRGQFAFDIGFGIVSDIGIAGIGTVPGCIGADTLQWGSSPPAGRQNCFVSGPPAHVHRRFEVSLFSLETLHVCSLVRG